MKIASSAVGMESSHQNISVQYSSLRLGIRMKQSEWDASQGLLSGDADNSESVNKDGRRKNQRNDSDKPAALIDLSKNGVDAAKGVTVIRVSRQAALLKQRMAGSFPLTWNLRCHVHLWSIQGRISCIRRNPCGMYVIL